MKRLLAVVAVSCLVVSVAAQESSSRTSKPKPSAARPAASETQTSAPAAQTAPARGRATAQPVEPEAEPRTGVSRPTPLPQEAPAPQLSARQELPEAAAGPTLPVGTTLKIRLETALSTSSSKLGDSFSGRVLESVQVEGRVLVPAGATVEGHVAHLSEPRRIRGVPMLDLRPESVVMPSGERYALSAVIVDTSDPKALDVDEEGRIKGRGADGRWIKDAVLFGGAGTVAGAVVTHSVRGGAIGAGAGMTVALVRWLARRHSAAMPEGTDLYLELSRPMTMSPKPVAD